ncbi:efflux transporter, outer membrane factor (OMF) lipoprotein, NodT family [Sphingomonas gellani]|uniref:Efflux transporter, outer membrane factor (OMF) lipoprotein, NodT family n=1 Tax=Sphingomonas gellani TaxID=1166340 RepID=A0A1H8EVR0_9SPHN|nr:efflux transporter outer membrane subunit [Sphingomonas gellani]SEN22987.1 efflux transporter, outer membrane factor (OMF) lipoprotein, NodT family [Sphingomonas gellani]
MRRPWWGAASAALLTGCTVGPNYRPSEAAVPAAFTEVQAAPGATLDPSTFWRSVGDTELDSLVARALVGNPEMAIAASRVRQARLDEIAARAAGLPQVNASAETTHVEFSKNAGFSSIARLFSGGSGGGASGGGTGGGGSGGSSSGIALPGSGITTYALGFDASWELDLFGGVRRQVEGERARTEAAEWSRRDAAVTLSGEVAQAYFALRLDQAQRDILMAEIARQNRALQIAGNTARAGLVPQVDITRQRAQLTGTQARLEPLAADIRVRIHALGVLTGTDPGSLATELTATPAPLGPLPMVPAGLPSDLLRRRPDVRSAERELAGATADIGVAVADLYPKFSLTGMAQLISTSLSSLFERDSLQLTGTGAARFPLVDFGRRRAAVRGREEARDQAYQRYRQAVLGALRDVEDPLAQLDAERRRNATLIRAVNDAAESAHATEAQYRTGFVAQDALLNAETQVLSAREQLAGSDAMLRQLTVTLFKAIGGGWSDQVSATAQDN